MNVEEKIFNLLKNSKFTQDVSITKNTTTISQNYGDEEFRVVIDGCEFFSRKIKCVNKISYTYNNFNLFYSLNQESVLNLIKSKTLKYYRKNRINKLISK